MSESECTSTIENCKAGDQSSWVTGTATAMVFLGAITGQITVSSLITIIFSITSWLLSFL